MCYLDTVVGGEISKVDERCAANVRPAAAPEPQQPRLRHDLANQLHTQHSQKAKTIIEIF